MAAAVGRFAAMRRWDPDIAVLKAYLAAMDATPAPSAVAVRAVFRALANAARNRYLETEHERLIAARGARDGGQVQVSDPGWPCR